MAFTSPVLTMMMRAAEKASKSLIRDFNEVEHLQVSRKGPGDFVSAADKRAEEIIYQELSKARPDFGFLMEESGEVKGRGGEFRFIIDPLDGTTNFLHGIPQWSISIGLEKKNSDGSLEIVSGLVFDPIKNEMFFAEKGTGAFLQRKRLRVSARDDLTLAVIGGGDCVRRDETLKAALIASLEKIIMNTAGFRRMGSAALDLSYVAAGRLDAFWEMRLAPWDCAAGTLIVREAGGKIESLKGDANPVYGEVILASNLVLHEHVKAMIKVV